jgi:hypothetical protein
MEANPLNSRNQISRLAWNADVGGPIFHGGEAHQEGTQLDATLLPFRRFDWDCGLRGVHLYRTTVLG